MQQVGIINSFACDPESVKSVQVATGEHFQL